MLLIFIEKKMLLIFVWKKIVLNILVIKLKCLNCLIFFVSDLIVMLYV